jgi:hypothetical protein
LDVIQTGQQHEYEVRDGGDHVLAVVEQQQRLSRPQRPRQLLGKGPSRGRGEIEGERNRRGHEGCIRQGRQVGPDDAIGEVLGALVGDGQGQPGLVGAAGPDQGEHRGRLVEQRGPRGRSLRIPADEPSPRRGQGRRIGRDRIGLGQSTISDCPAEGAR